MTTLMGSTTWLGAALVGDLAGAIEAYVRAFDYVTFAELKSHLGTHFELAGDVAMVNTTDPNIVIWGGMSVGFYDAVTGLLREGRMRMESASVLTYLIDGAASRLPVVKRPPKRGYKDPHWLPVCLRPSLESGESVQF